MNDESIIDHICPVCHTSYRGETWKKKCYDCWKNFKSRERIEKLGYKCNVYLTHPSVTAEEIEKYILDHKFERGWGVKEWNPENPPYKIWLDDTNWD